MNHRQIRKEFFLAAAQIVEIFFRHQIFLKLYSRKALNVLYYLSFNIQPYANTK